MLATVDFHQLAAQDVIVAIDGRDLPAPRTVASDQRRADGAVLLVHPEPNPHRVEWALYPDSGERYAVQRPAGHATGPTPVHVRVTGPGAARRPAPVLSVRTVPADPQLRRPADRSLVNLTEIQRAVLRRAYRAGGLLAADTNGTTIGSLRDRGLVGRTSATFVRGGHRHHRYCLTPAGAAWAQRDQSTRPAP